MNRRNNLPGVHDQFTSPTSPRHLKRTRGARGSAAGGLSRLWFWSRIRLCHAEALLERWFHFGRRALLLRVGSRCCKGPVRELNEDRCYADHCRGLFVVADGMGGHVGGEQASQTVMEVIASLLGDVTGRQESFTPLVAEAVRGAIHAANRELAELARVDVGLNGMGSTVVVGVVHRNQLLLSWVGDSRAYLFRKNALRQLSVDDTLVQGLVSAGALTTGEAARHPMRHVLIHSVGTRAIERPLRVDSYKLRSGDRLLFTTDGLTDAVDHHELLTLLRKYPDARQAASALADAAHDAGSRDNVTCIVVDLMH